MLYCTAVSFPAYMKRRITCRNETRNGVMCACSASAKGAEGYCYKGHMEKWKSRGPKGPKRCKKKKGTKGITFGSGEDEAQEPITPPADPWIYLRSPLGGKLSPVEEWKRLERPGVFSRELTLKGQTAEEALQAATPEALASVARRVEGWDTIISESDAIEGSAATGSPAIEKLVIGGEVASRAIPPSRVAKDLLTCRLVSLDLGGAQVGDDSVDRVARWAPWLRELNVSGNGLKRVPDLEGLQKLQSLDVSHNDIQGLGPNGFPPDLGPSLRKLNLGFNRLSTLIAHHHPAAAGDDVVAQQPRGDDNSPPCALDGLTSLLYLNVGGNNFQARETSLAFVTRTRFPWLFGLDFAGNPLPDEQQASEARRIISSLPTLKRLNDEDVKRDPVKVSSSARPMYELVSTVDQDADTGTGTCTEGVPGEESCSCIEGNPCVSAYGCLDWPNRFAVATAAAAGSPRR